jgi:hypothetical protein
MLAFGQLETRSHGGYDMTNNREAFQNGATAFRNLRDLTEKRRQEVIDQATDDPTVD